MNLPQSHLTLCNPATPLPGCPWDQSPRSAILEDFSPEQAVVKTLHPRNNSSAGGHGPAPCPSTGFKSFTPQGQQWGRSYLDHSDNASSPRQSPGKPCCTRSACHRDTSVSGGAPVPQAVQREGGRQRVPGLQAAQEELEMALGPPPAASLHLAGLTLWPGARHFPGALQGLAVLKAAVLLSPMGSGIYAP